MKKGWPGNDFLAAPHAASSITSIITYRTPCNALKRLPGKERRAGTLLARQLIASSMTAGERTRAGAEP